MITLLDLPNEILLMITDQLEAEDISRLLRTCQLMATLLDSILYRTASDFICGYGYSVLEWAARRGQRNTIRKFFKNCKDQDSSMWMFPDAKERALSCATAYCAEQVKRSGLSDQEKEDALFHSIYFRIIKLLLRRGAHFNAEDAHGATPLHIAADNNMVTLALFFIMLGCDLKHQDYDGCTPLHCAARSGSKNIALLLISNKAKVNARDNRSWTCLHYAAAVSGTKDSEAVVKLLLENGAHAHVQGRGHYNCTPLLLAAENGHENIVRLLLQHGARAKTRASGGDTPLSLAVEKGYFGVVRLLLEHGIDIKDVPVELHPMVMQNELNTGEDAMPEAKRLKTC